MSVQDQDMFKNSNATIDNRASMPAQHYSFFESNQPAMSGTINSKDFNSFLDGLQKAFEKLSPNYKAMIWPIDQNSSGFYYSTVLLAVAENTPESPIVYFTYIVEHTNTVPTPDIKVINGETIQTPKVSSNMIDRDYHKVISERLKTNVKNSGMYGSNNKFEYSGSIIVAREFDCSVESDVEVFAIKGAIACVTRLNKMLGKLKEINLAGLNSLESKRDKEYLVTDTVFGNGDSLDINGLPVRSSISTKLAVKRHINGAERVSLSQQNKNSVDIARVNSYMEILWAPVQDNSFNKYNPNATMNQITDPRKYLLNMVITSIEPVNKPETFATSGLLLSIVSAILSISEDKLYLKSFFPTKFNDDTINLTDVSVLNIAANIQNDPSGYGQPFETGTGQPLQPNDVINIFNVIARDGFIVSIDCASATAQSLETDIFRRAKGGDKESVDEIYNAANTLFGGNFAKHFSPKTPMFREETQYMQLGYYSKPHGNTTVKKDVRNLDQLAASNIFIANPDYAFKYQDTFLVNSTEQVLNTRRKFINGMCEPYQFVQTDIGERIFLTNEFVEAMIKSMRDCGVAISPSEVVSGVMFGESRQNANSFATSLFVNNVQGVYAQPFGQQGYTSPFRSW